MYKNIILFTICIFLCCSGVAIAQAAPTPIPDGQIVLAWDQNSETDLEGYQLYRGTVSGVYDTVVNVGKQATYTVTGLIVGKLYYFVITAYDNSNNESGYSVEVTGTGKDKTNPVIPSGLHEVIEEITIIAKTVNIVTRP